MSKFKITLEVDVPNGDDYFESDIRRNVELLFVSASGEQELELMNWEPIPMTVSKCAVRRSMDTATFTPCDPATYHGVLMEEVRTKLFVRKHNLDWEKDDVEQAFWDFQEELQEKAQKGELHSHFDDVPGFHYNYTDGSVRENGIVDGGSFEWKDFSGDTSHNIPVEEI